MIKKIVKLRYGNMLLTFDDQAQFKDVLWNQIVEDDDIFDDDGNLIATFEEENDDNIIILKSLEHLILPLINRND